jgi:DNA-directed RNA polymerase specialized sigma24 family protein
LRDDESEPEPVTRAAAHTKPFRRKADWRSVAPWMGEVDKLTLQYAIAGDRAAFERLVLLHQRGVYRFVGVVVGPKRRAAAPAITIDTFDTAERRLKSYDLNGACRLWTWLYGLAWEVALRSPEGQPGALQPALAASVSSLWDRFDELPMEQRVAALLQTEDHSVPEMAQILRTTVADAEVHAECARRALLERGIALPQK